MGRNIEIDFGDLNDSKAVYGILVIIMLPVFAVGLQTAGLNVFQVIGADMCVNGASESYIQSNAYDYTDNRAWKVIFTTGCNDEIAGGGGTIDNQEIQDTQDGNLVKAQKDFTLKMRYFKAWFWRGIYRGSADSVYTYETTTIDCGGLSGCGQNAYDKANSWQNAMGIPDTSYEEYVVERGSYGDYWLAVSRADGYRGEIYEWSSESGSKFEAGMTLCAGNTCGSGTLTKDDKTAVIKSNGQRAEVTWMGSRVSSIRDVDYSLITPAYKPGTGVIVAATSNVNDWYNYVSANSLEDCLQQRSRDQVQSCDNEIDDLAHNTITHQEEFFEERFVEMKPEVIVKSDEVRVQARDDNAVERPVFEATIDTGWIGILEEVPQPRIGGLADFSMKMQDSVLVQVPVTNVGSKAGYIDTTITCENSLSGGSQQLYVEKGETKTYEIRVSGGTTTPSNYDCHVEARASGASGDKAVDTKSFTVTLEEKTATCPDCFGSNPNNDDGNSNTGDVVRPPNRSINWVNVGIAIGALLLIAGGILWWRENQ